MTRWHGGTDWSREIMPQFRYNANKKGMDRNKRDAALKRAKKQQPGRYAGHQFRWVSTQTQPMTKIIERKVKLTEHQPQQKRKPKAG